MDSKVLWLWLGHICGISRRKRHKLLEVFGNIENIYKASPSEYKELGFLREEEIESLNKKDLEGCIEEIEHLEDMGIKVIDIDSPLYPQILKNTDDCPTLIYTRGKFIDLNKHFCIAMVGTRKPTRYGQQCALTLSKKLSNAGVVVVSGMADGIDAYCHKGAMRGSSPTVAVIGCGVDIAYPRSNAGLMNEIMKNGMVISEYPVGSCAERYHFPERNRIISGVSHGVVVVEADFKSGSLITARCAAEQGRDVFAVPGEINSMCSKGTNFLIKDGAHAVTGADDIVSYYKYDYPELSDKCDKVSAEEEPKTDSPDDMVLSAIGSESVHIDKIQEETKLDMGYLNAKLLMLELSGAIIKLPGGFYMKSE